MSVELERVAPIIRCKNHPDCMGSAADAPMRGPYAGLCKDCRGVKGTELSQRGRDTHKRSAASGVSYEGHTLDGAVKKLAAAGKRLERAVAADADTRKEKQLAISEFSAAIRAVNEQARRVLNGPTVQAARVEERMDRELHEIRENGDEPE